MPATTIGDIVDIVIAFEQRIGVFYSNLRDNSLNNDVRLLAYYLSRQRRRILGVMNSCDPRSSESIRSTVAEGPSIFKPEDEFFVIDTPVTQVEGKDLLAAALNYSECLLRLYELLLSLANTDHCRDIFSGIIETEKKDITMIKKMQTMQYF